MSDAIEIIYTEIEAPEGSKSVLGQRARTVTKVGRLDDDRLAQNLSAFCRRMGIVLEDATTAVPTYDLTSFELTIEITAKGELRLIGGVSAETRGGIKLIFSRTTGD